ncbi:TadE family protein [Salinimonas iocasae]|nr:TadE family protein [Salinimonas iocasae]
MRNHKPISKQKGVAAVEFTIIAPFMFLLIFATAEFGRLFYQYSALTNSVRLGARYIADIAIKDNTGNFSLTDNDRAKATNLIVSGDTNGQSELLPGLNEAIFDYQLNGDFITVTASYSWSPIFSDTLFSLSDNNAISLDFPMEVSYTVRVLP